MQGKKRKKIKQRKKSLLLLPLVLKQHAKITFKKLPNFVLSLKGTTIHCLTNVVGHKIRRETLGTVAERRVIVRVAAKDEQSAAEEDGRVEVPREAALFQDEPANASVAEMHELCKLCFHNDSF